jgi:hypothetical protein
MKCSITFFLTIKADACKRAPINLCGFQVTESALLKKQRMNPTYIF